MCTRQLKAGDYVRYNDEFSWLFNNHIGVVVRDICIDSLTTHVLVKFNKEPSQYWCMASYLVKSNQEEYALYALSTIGDV